METVFILANSACPYKTLLFILANIADTYEMQP